MYSIFWNIQCMTFRSVQPFTTIRSKGPSGDKILPAPSSDIFVYSFTKLMIFAVSYELKMRQTNLPLFLFAYNNSMNFK